MALHRRADAPADSPLWLDGEALELLSVEVDGVAVSPARLHADPAGLRIDSLPADFVLRTVVAIAPASNTALMGLFMSNGDFFTQCEAQGFRRITYFPDRPDVMARYAVELIADPARWIDPFPKPSYLFALVAGNLVAQEARITTRSGREALLQVWVEPGNLDRTDHAMQSLIRSIRWEEQRFGLELDLDRFMIVAVADFNMGAMENKGLNIFNSKYVFAHPHIATDADYANIEAIVAHEYFHNCTGSRVTCRDWFQLTLKEGLTRFRRRYAQVGTPRGRAEGRHDPATRTYVLTLTQSCPPSPGQPEKAPVHVPVAVGLIGSDGRELARTTLVLVDATQTFVFDGIDPGSAPDGRRFVVASLLRDFSAPVILEHAVDDDTLAFQLAHDGDAFNRWEASQRLAVSAILRALGGEPVGSSAAALIGALGRALEDTTLDPALREQLLLMPSEGFVAEQLPVIDPVALRAARNTVRDALARGFALALRASVEAMRPDGPYSPDPKSAGRRALRNAALGLLVEAGIEGADALAAGQIASTDNMTDRLGALGALVRG